MRESGVQPYPSTHQTDEADSANGSKWHPSETSLAAENHKRADSSCEPRLESLLTSAFSALRSRVLMQKNDPRATVDGIAAC